MVFIAKTQFSHKQFYNHFCIDFILGGTNSRQQHLELIVLTEPVWLTVFCFKIIFQVQVLKPKDFSRILSPRRCVVIIYKIMCKVKVVKVKNVTFCICKYVL